MDAPPPTKQPAVSSGMTDAPLGSDGSVAASTGVQSIRVSLTPGKYARTLSPSSPIPIDKTVVASDSSTLTPRYLLGTPVSPPTTQHATSEQSNATPYHTIAVLPLVEPPPDLITPADSTLPTRRAILVLCGGPNCREKFIASCIYGAGVCMP